MGIPGVQPPLTSEQIGVVVVEDEPTLLLYACEILADAGLFAFAAANAEEAVALLRERGDIQVLITDVSFANGGMDGWQLVRLVATMWPHIGQLVVSGGSRPTAGELPAGVRFMHKPYRSHELVSQVFRFVTDGTGSI
jgi:CheY-like chemotaxis protein